jgi:hypothetical protein
LIFPVDVPGISRHVGSRDRQRKFDMARNFGTHSTPNAKAERARYIAEAARHGLASVPVDSKLTDWRGRIFTVAGMSPWRTILLRDANGKEYGMSAYSVRQLKKVD